MEEDIVKKHYSKIAKMEETDEELTRKVAREYAGYTEDDLSHIPLEASLGLGCGNSCRAAELKEGEMVIDLGCGAGMDVFLAGSRVGPKGKAVGVDFSKDMVDRAKELASMYKRENVEFHMSEITSLPFAPNTFDVAISNCVLNLVPDKQKAFSEIFRVLKVGGRLVISDIVVKKALPEDLRKDIAAQVGCIGRAVDEEKYNKELEMAGFKSVSITDTKKDLKALYFKPGFSGKKVACCACKKTACCSDKKEDVALDTSVVEKYDLNEFVMSCIVKGFKTLTEQSSNQLHGQSNDSIS